MKSLIRFPVLSTIIKFLYSGLQQDSFLLNHLLVGFLILTIESNSCKTGLTMELLLLSGYLVYSSHRLSSLELYKTMLASIKSQLMSFPLTRKSMTNLITQRLQKNQKMVVSVMACSLKELDGITRLIS